MCRLAEELGGINVKKNKLRLFSSALALTLATTTIWGTAPLTQAQTVEIVQEATQQNAELAHIKLHAKGEALHLHAWTDTIPNANGDYPGNAMTEEGDGWYFWEGDCTGFLITKADKSKVTANDVVKPSGEYWYMDGEFYTSDPRGGGDTPAPIATTAPVVSETPATQAPVTNSIQINSITPADGTNVLTGQKQTITVDATSSIGDGVVYYRYDITHNGTYVGDHYYTKNNSWDFTPAEDGAYTVKVSVQAHDEDNTTKTQTINLTASSQGAVVTAGPNAVTNAPIPTQVPDSGNANGGTNQTPGTNNTNGGTNQTPGTSNEQNGGTNQTPGTSNEQNGGTNQTPGTSNEQNGGTNQTPGTSNAPGSSSNAGSNIDNGGANVTPGNTSNTNNNNTNVTVNTNTNSNASVASAGAVNLTIKAFAANVASPQKAGTAIQLEAKAEGGTAPYTYEFYYVKGNGTVEQVIQAGSEKNTCVWTPKTAGTYKLFVSVTDKYNNTKTSKMDYVISGMKVSMTANKKSPQKKKKVIRLTAKATGTTGSVKYKFVIKRSGKTTVNTGFKTSKTYKWKPTKAGKYKITLTVKDKLGSTSKTFSYRIK